MRSSGLLGDNGNTYMENLELFSIANGKHLIYEIQNWSDCKLSIGKMTIILCMQGNFPSKLFNNFHINNFFSVSMSFSLFFHSSHLLFFRSIMVATRIE